MTKSECEAEENKLSEISKHIHLAENKWLYSPISQ